MATESIFDINTKEISGTAYKTIMMKKSIIRYLVTNGDSTIADVGKELNFSTPTITKLINELAEEEYILDFGKIETGGGRRPYIYGLNPKAGYFMGVEVKWTGITLAIMDFQKNVVKIEENISYQLENSKECLEELCLIIEKFIKKSELPREKILGICVNLSGRVNTFTGYSYSFFYLEEEPLASILRKRLGIRCLVENDTRAMTYGEYQCGIVNGEQNFLFINLSRGVGMGIVINGQLYYGKSGFSGEFGHIPFYENEIICKCGKKGCMETEMSGRALERKIIENIEKGSSSCLVSKVKDGSISPEDIIEAINNEDMLAIDLISELGGELGKGIAMLINLYNPELVVIGGYLAYAKDYLLLPVKSAINKYALSMVSNDTVIKLSKLGNKAGVIGAGLLVQNKLLEL